MLLASGYTSIYGHVLDDLASVRLCSQVGHVLTWPLLGGASLALAFQSQQYGGGTGSIALRNYPANCQGTGEQVDKAKGRGREGGREGGSSLDQEKHKRNLLSS